MAKLRKIEIAEATAERLEARAEEEGVSLSELLDEMAGANDVWPTHLEKMREEGRGPWSPESLAEDARRLEEFDRTRMGIPLEDIEAWAKSLGTANELSRPKPRRV
jgi:hypothetical protein